MRKILAQHTFSEPQPDCASYFPHISHLQQIKYRFIDTLKEGKHLDWASLKNNTLVASHIDF